MTVIFGSNFGDTLFASSDNSTIFGGAGNDYIFGNIGFDFIDGGSGFDVVDYSSLNTPISLEATGIVDKGMAGVDQLTSIEAIIAPVGQFNLIDASTPLNSPVSMMVDLAANSLIVNGIPGVGSLSRTVVNFTDVIGTSGDDIIAGNSQDNLLIGGAGNDYFFGSVGFDFIDGGSGFDVVDYRFLNTPISLEATGIVDKGMAGVDQLASIEAIIAPAGQFNLIDASTPFDSPVSIVVDLAFNSLTVNGIPGAGSLSRTVVNFTDVIGSSGDDIIFGNSQDNLLIGGAGDDLIFGDGGNNLLFGGSGNDILIGGPGNDVLNGYGFTNGEIDVLVGGGGSDLFVLGDAFGPYYLGSGYAIIEDFNPFEGDLIQVFGSSSNYSLAFQPFTSTNTLDTLIFAGSDLIGVVAGTTDVIPALDFVTA
jgi:Ca2+-binding RTX toxin-like protein